QPAFAPDAPEARRSARRLLRSQLWAQILVALLLGFGLGIALSPEGGFLFALTADRAAALGPWLTLPGNVFLNLIQLIVIPLVVSSIALGLTSAGDPALLRRLAAWIVPYFLATSTVAVLIGTGLALWIEPGALLTMPATVEAVPDLALTQDNAGDLPERIPALIPPSLTAASLSRDMLQIVLVAILLGLALVTLPETTARPLLDLLGALQAVTLKVVAWAMLLAPVAVFGLICDFALRAGLSAMIGLSAYMATVILGLGVLLAFYMLVVRLLARRSPLAFARAVVEAQLLAFATSSSAATMPLSLRVATERLGVDVATARFVVPLGATVNMDGTALYQVVATIFLAQVYGIALDPAAFVLLTVSVVGASIGSPSTPGVGIVILAGILASIGIPAEGVAVLLGVDRLLDMCRTAVNVTGDLTACVVMDRILTPRRA
ncbi:dicarboxylate/amino acid:cation symporter, partial [Jannaschia donghaensis]|uniref:dicarboxylate/amino acid:cation symporter n=1 Tax=Jannaschia donghaensis TaxID=420998 RepID=UPI0009FABBC0